MDAHPRLLILNRFKPFLTVLEEERMRHDSLLANEPQFQDTCFRDYPLALPTASPFINRITQVIDCV
jgi:hypothetical protein